jgi:hypothetical protein
MVGECTCDEGGTLDAMLAVFTAAIFVSAALLFLVQPMAAKMVLPLLGGSPAVWTTCMLFFQTLLLAGYLYAHLLNTYVRSRLQPIVHSMIILAAAASLPLGLPAITADSSGIIGRLPSELAFSAWLILVLVISVGAPFFVVSTTGPLLQTWFSRTGHAHAKDPYFLYAASNAGSMIGLAAYPLAFEPLLGTRNQGIVWSAGYAAFALLSIACGVILFKRGDDDAARREAAGATDGSRESDCSSGAAPLAWSTKLRWLVLAAVPSSLMLGVTQHVSTDIASMPLIWIIPLALYLLTFILAFSPRIKVPTGVLGYVFVALALTMTATIALSMKYPLALLMAGHFAVFFAGGLMCHRLLADERPAPRHLTTYFLIMAAGGAAGGLFNSLVAPTFFDNIYEYAIALTAAAACRPRPRPKAGEVIAAVTPARSQSSLVIRRLVYPLLMLVVMATVALVLARRDWHREIGYSTVYSLDPWVRAGLPILLAMLVVRRPLQFAACLGVFGASVFFAKEPAPATLIHQERSFFGVLKVYEEFGGVSRTLSHGTTTHGVQVFRPEHLRYKPSSYYHPTGPIGQIYEAYGNDPRLKHVAIIGLGTGAMAAYAQPGEKYTFYEIDSSVVSIATGGDSPGKYFTFLKDARGEIEIVLADGRLGIESHAKDGEYGLIVVDAFSSDAIPVHLITLEAVELYRRKLTPDGLLAIHISNRHFELAPVVAKIADTIGMVPASCMDGNHNISEAEKDEGKQSSHWIVLANREEDLLPLQQHPKKKWSLIGAGPSVSVWTDDYSYAIGAIKFD